MKKEENILKKFSVNIKNTDLFFLQLTFALIITGLLFATTSSTHVSLKLTNSFWTLGIKQLIAAVVGLCLLIVFWRINYKIWDSITWLFAIVTLILMLVTVFTGIGKTTYGATRWIDFGIVQFQPSEIAKFAVVLLLAKFVSQYRWYEFKSYYYLLTAFVLILIILKQDLGSAGVLVLLTLEMLFIFGWPIWMILSFCIASFLLAYFKIKNTPYQLARIESWLNPYLDPQGHGYNLIQAQYALGFGGLVGRGLGNSIQKQGYLPIPHSDFIFAVIAEEIGLLGVSAILFLFIAWIFRGLYLVNKTKEKYAVVLGSAIIFLIGSQAVINILVAIGLLPVTGITLPFFSCGGTSLIVTLAMCGILLNVVSNKQPEEIDR